MSSPPEDSKPSVMLPLELWMNLLDSMPAAAKGIATSIRLSSGQVIEKLIIETPGNILGQRAPGIAGAHGDMDCSMLRFKTDDIQAVQVPALHFWQRPEWISRNLRYPTRTRLESGIRHSLKAGEAD